MYLYIAMSLMLESPYQADFQGIKLGTMSD